MRYLFVDAAYDRRMLMGKTVSMNFTIEAERKLEERQKFAAQPRHWAVEFTFRCLMPVCVTSRVAPALGSG